MQTHNQYNLRSSNHYGKKYSLTHIGKVQNVKTWNGRLGYYFSINYHVPWWGTKTTEAFVSVKTETSNRTATKDKKKTNQNKGKHWIYGVSHVDMLLHVCLSNLGFVSCNYYL